MARLKSRPRLLQRSPRSGHRKSSKADNNTLAQTKTERTISKNSKEVRGTINTIAGGFVGDGSLNSTKEKVEYMH